MSIASKPNNFDEVVSNKNFERKINKARRCIAKPFLVKEKFKNKVESINNCSLFEDTHSNSSINTNYSYRTVGRHNRFYNSTTSRNFQSSNFNNNNSHLNQRNNYHYNRNNF